MGTVERPIPQAQPGQLLLRVHACGVCRTDLHLLDGELEIAQPPRVLGHLELAPRMPVRTTVTSYPLGEAAQALEDLRAGRFTGAAVIVP